MSVLSSVAGAPSGEQRIHASWYGYKKHVTPVSLTALLQTETLSGSFSLVLWGLVNAIRLSYLKS